MLPSIKTLENAFPGHGKKLRAILEMPVMNRVTLQMLNEELDQHGVECIDDGIRPLFSYVNNGETYNVTIGYDHRTQNFRVTSWGDWVQAYERKHGRLP